MILTEPLPFDEALEAIGRRTPVAAALSSAQWEEMPLALRDRAMFSAQVTQLPILAQVRTSVDALAQGRTDRATQRVALRKLVDALTGPTSEDDQGTVRDLRSDARLDLILDTNLQMAQGYGAFTQGQDPEILDLWPAQELVRVRDAEEPRDWAARWAEAGGTFFGSRMIALKNDPIWTRISRFGLPYPPFDYNSGMDVSDVDRDTAIAAGLIDRDTQITPPREEFNASLQASLPEASPEVVEGFREIFGDQVDVSRDGKIVWQGTRIRHLYEQALADNDVKWTLDLGAATPTTTAAARGAGVDLADARLKLDADHVRHAVGRHGEPGARGPGTGETRGDQRPLTPQDFELVPHVWREPDEVVAGAQPGTLELRKEILGKTVAVLFDREAKSPSWGVRTLYVKERSEP